MNQPDRSALGVAIVVDQKWRDLPAGAALACWLEERCGLSTLLLPYSRWRETLVSYRPRVLVITHANGTRNRAIIDFAKSIGTRVAVVQTEGRPNNIYTMDYIVGKGLRAEGIDLWFAWGPVVRDFMIERNVLPPEKIVVAGCHRFDFYRPPFNALIGRRQELVRKFGLDPDRPLVSLATNFTTAEAHADEHKRQFLERDWADLGLSRFEAYSNPGDFARRDHEARERMLEIVRGLLRARPAIQLLVKPHPAETHARYIRFAEDCRRDGLSVVFVGVDFIWNLIGAVDVHIHRLCTTGVEAWFTGVPSIDLHPEDYYGWSMQLEGAASEAAAGHDLVRDADALIARVDHYLGGGTPDAACFAARDRYIERWLDKVDGQRTSVHAEHLARLAGIARVDMAPLRERARVLGRRAFTHTFGDPWGAERGLLGRDSREDQLGQVDCRISPDDAKVWMNALRGIVGVPASTATADMTPV